MTDRFDLTQLLFAELERCINIKALLVHLNLVEVILSVLLPPRPSAGRQADDGEF